MVLTLPFLGLMAFASVMPAQDKGNPLDGYFYNPTRTDDRIAAPEDPFGGPTHRNAPKANPSVYPGVANPLLQASGQPSAGGLPVGVSGDHAQAAGGNADPHALLRSLAKRTDDRSQEAAARIRKSAAGNAKAIDPRARPFLRPMVAEAFRARQQLHEAELKQMQQRVEKLSRLLAARQKSEAEIIDRRVDELLNPDLRWNAAASETASGASATAKSSMSADPVPEGPRPVTASRTRHFWVESDPFAASVEPNLLATIAQDAEAAYKELTRQWFDHSPIAFAGLCGIDVMITGHDGRSSTTYKFNPDGKISSAMMHIEGRKEDISGMLRHEVMHLVLAAQFKVALPRWIDEGISVMQESEEVPQRFHRRVADSRTSGTLFPLRELFTMHAYPKDVTLMYAQACMIVDWLIGRGGKKKLVACLRRVDPDAMAEQLPAAIVAEFGFENLADLEAQWLDSLQPDRDIKSR